MSTFPWHVIHKCGFYVLDFIFPKFCLGCRKWGRYVCGECLDKIQPLPYLKCPVCQHPAIGGMTHPRCRTRFGIDGIFSFFRYDGIVKKAIKDVKYRFVSDIVEELISHAPTSSFSSLTKLLSSKPLSFLIVPIPLHWSRANFRGFNQSEVLALKLAKRLNIPVRRDILMRKQRTKPQVEMKNRKDRFKNMEEVFQINRNSEAMKQPASTQRGECSNSAIILVDDVSTTGATLRSAASILKRAGATYVFGVTIAQ